MKLGQEDLGELWLNECRLWLSLHGGPHPRGPSATPSPVLQNPVLHLNWGQKPLEFSSLYRWQMVAWSSKPFDKRVKLSLSQRWHFCL